MRDIESHPTVRSLRLNLLEVPRLSLTQQQLRQLCLDAGADDVGFVSIDRSELAHEADGIRRVFPATKTLICVVCRMNAPSVRSPARSIANAEFHHTGDHVNDVLSDIVKALAHHGVRAVNPAMAFPMEMDRFPDKIWTVSLKTLAVAAGLGQMGIHRNLIHPKFGNFVLLGTVLIDAEVAEQGQPIDYNPCLECKLCVAACPVGAISPQGDFNFASCYTHNYREFMGGFTDWIETIAQAGSAKGYRKQVTDGESASMWQSLAYGPNYKAAYCMSVCPAGEEVIAPFLADKPAFVNQVMKPLQQKQETVYVRPNSDAEDYVQKRHPHKKTKRVGPVLRPSSIAGFITAMEHVFQPGQAGTLNAVYHLRFTGEQPAECTVTISGGKISVDEGLIGKCNLRMTADSTAWLRFLRHDVSMPWLLLTLKVRLRGDPRLLSAFGRCFP